MNRILLATTALIAATTIANAQAVSISGEGRMGVLYERFLTGGASVTEWAQENRLVLDFTVAVQGDHGLSFGAYTRAQIDNGTAGLFSGSNVYVEASGLRLSFGNLDGAILTSGTSHGFGGGCGIGYVGGHYCGDSAGLVGLFTLGLVPALSGNAVISAFQAQEFDYTGGGDPAMARLDYSFGETAVSLSHQRGGSTELGVRSRFDAVTVALGYSNRANLTGLVAGDFVAVQVPGSVVSLSGHYNGGNWGVGAIVARVSHAGILSPFDHTNYSVSGTVELGGGSLYAYVGRVFHAGVGGRIPFRTAGVSYGYGLGGGATLTGGIEQISGSGLSWVSASVGVAFSF